MLLLNSPYLHKNRASWKNSTVINALPRSFTTKEDWLFSLEMRRKHQDKKLPKQILSQNYLLSIPLKPCLFFVKAICFSRSAFSPPPLLKWYISPNFKLPIWVLFVWVLPCTLVNKTWSFLPFICWFQFNLQTPLTEPKWTEGKLFLPDTTHEMDRWSHKC